MPVIPPRFPRESAGTACTLLGILIPLACCTVAATPPTKPNYAAANPLCVTTTLTDRWRRIRRTRAKLEFIATASAEGQRRAVG